MVSRNFNSQGVLSFEKITKILGKRFSIRDPGLPVNEVTGL